MFLPFSLHGDLLHSLLNLHQLPPHIPWKTIATVLAQDWGTKDTSCKDLVGNQGSGDWWPPSSSDNPFPRSLHRKRSERGDVQVYTSLTYQRDSTPWKVPATDRF